LGARHAAVVAAVLVVAMTAAGCSLGAKQDVADRARGARDAGRGTHLALVSIGIRPRDLPASAVSDQAKALSGGTYAGGVGVVDTSAGTWEQLAPPAAAARLASLSGTAPKTPPPLVFTTRQRTFVRRPARDVLAARSWYRLDLDRAREVTKPNVVTALTARNPSDLAVLTPTLMVDLLAGVLAGSVEQHGSQITGRLSIDKANREDDLDDDAVDARREALRLFAVTQDVHEFDLQLASDGSIDQLELRLRMTPDKQTSLDLVWKLDVQNAAVAAATPKDGEVVRISSYNQARGAVAAWIAQ
jgi:hypothetical protein